jgi:hypothetical protein
MTQDDLQSLCVSKKGQFYSYRTREIFALLSKFHYNPTELLAFERAILAELPKPIKEEINADLQFSF